LLAVPRINILGVVISTIVSFALAAGLNLFFLYRTTRIVPAFGGAFGKPLLAAAAMGAVCWALHVGFSHFVPGWAATLVALLLGGIVYVLVMLLVGGFRPEDIAAAPLPAGVKRWLRR